MNNSVLVIGGGIAGIQASLDLANMGFKVYLVEKSPSIGGRMAQLDKTFPTNDCAMCILAPKMIEANSHPNIELLTYSEVEKVSGEAGKFKSKVKKKASFVDWSKCTGCSECAKVCPVELNSEFNENLGKRKATYIPFPQAIPNKYTIDKRGYPPCRVACPARVNAQGYVALISQGKFKEALEVIRRTMPFAGVCGRVCTHPCEQDCERGHFDEPVAIRSLKRFAADYELQVGREKVTPIERTKEGKVAIIGSGPAGLACAYDLIRKGYAVTVFEALPQAGGLLRYGIPEYRLPKDIVDNDVGYIQELGVEIKINTPVKDLGKVFNQGYKAIFLGVGCQESMKLGIPNEGTKGVIYALDFLKRANSGVKIDLGNQVAIIGGGSVAIDCARVALRLGSKEVHLVCLESRDLTSKDRMLAQDLEIKEAEEEGLIIHPALGPKRILTEDRKVAGLETRVCISVRDEQGRFAPRFAEGPAATIEADTIIIATGQRPSKVVFKEIEKSPMQTIKVDPVTLYTNLEGVFAGGDVVSGPADVIAAITAGKEAAISIDRYLRGIDMKEGRPATVTRVREVSKAGVRPKARQSMPTLEVGKRKGFDEVALGFNEKMAVEEAKRCLNCAVCSECRECEKVCEANAVDHEMQDEYVELNVGAIILASGLGLYDISALTEYGYGKIKNVITAMEFERLTAASGPTMGELKRPSDGRIPENIAFIQCVGSRDFRNKAYCSSVCCMHATKEAMLAFEHHPGTKSTIFYMDMRAVGKRFQEYIARAKKEYNTTYIRGRPGRIEVNPENDNPIVWYEETTSGEIKSFEAELVVLAQAMVPQITENLAKKLGIELDEDGFVKVPDKLLQPLDTTRSGIFACGYVHSPRDIPDSVTQASGAAGRAAEEIASLRSQGGK